MMEKARQLGKIRILGAGPTGLGAAYQLQQRSIDDWLIFEASDYVGGLAASFRDEHGFTWDVGGHVEFSHYAQYDRMAEDVLGSDRVWHERKAWVCLEDRFVPYPFQHNLHRLGSEQEQRAHAGLRQAALEAAADTQPPANFLEWIYRTFGAGIADLFMIPYNKKVWGYPLELLATDWIADRIAMPHAGPVREKKSASDQSAWGPNRTFWYPLRGGTGETWRRLAARIDGRRTRLGVAVAAVDLDARTILLADGHSLAWDTLITTIPLDVFCALCYGLPDDIQAAARSLLYSACHVFGVGLRGPMPEFLRNATWMYFPRQESPYYRVTVLSGYSPHNAPPGCWSLLAEVSETSQRRLITTDLAEDVIAAMRRDGLIPNGAEVVSRWNVDAQHGYPTPFVGRDDILNRILPFLENSSVYSRGRFGAWKYEVSNQDHSFMQGVELVERLLGVGEELTFLHPDVINRRR